MAVTFDQPQRGVATGQTIAFYDRDRVVGSATIASTSREPQQVAP
jgi:tRNA-specific 2-thiouridylase